MYIYLGWNLEDENLGVICFLYNDVFLKLRVWMKLLRKSVDKKRGVVSSFGYINIYR